MNRSGIRVVVIMKRVAVGRSAGGFEQAVGIRSRQEWYRYKMSKEQLVGITGQTFMSPLTHITKFQNRSTSF